MTTCSHKHIELLPEEEGRLRCRHCHLTLKPADLEGGCCPECLEEQGLRRCDFEELAPPWEQNTRYRCEDCGAVIEVE